MFIIKFYICISHQVTFSNPLGGKLWIPAFSERFRGLLAAAKSPLAANSVKLDITSKSLEVIYTHVHIWSRHRTSIGSYYLFIVIIYIYIAKP